MRSVVALSTRRGAVRDHGASRGTTSSGRRSRIRRATGWPSWPGTTRTCRGMPRSCWSCPSHAAAPRTHGHGARLLRPAGPPWPSPAVPASRSASPPGGGDGSLRFVSDRQRLVAALRGGCGRRGPSRRRCRRRRRSSTGPTGCSAQRTMAETARRHAGRAADDRGPGRDRRPALAAWTRRTAALPEPSPALRLHRRSLRARRRAWPSSGARPTRPPTSGSGRRRTGARPLRPQPAACRSAVRTSPWGSPSRLTGRSGRAVHGTLYRPTLARDRGSGRRARRRW